MQGIFLLLFVLAFISPVVVISQPNNPPPDYYQIALLWPKSFCNSRHNPNLYPKPKPCYPDPPTQRKFTLHGLWPDNYTEQTTPTFCTNELYMHPGSLLPQLRNIWPNLLNKFSYKLWSDQWGKHGTCAYTTQSTYFQLALDLANAVRLDSVLHSGGIRFGSINTKDVVSIIRSSPLGVIPIVKCTQYDNYNNKQLSEVVVCHNLSATGSGFIDCPRNRWPGGGVSGPSNCPNHYILP